MKAAERALYGPGSWRRWIDVASAVDFALLNELFKNEDGFHASTYMALGADGRLHLGPIWDFDISMGNSDYGPSRRLRGWPVLNRRSWPNPVARGSFRAEVRFLRSWLVRRIDWLDVRSRRSKASKPPAP